MRATMVSDTIPDGFETPFVITKEGSAACCRQLLGDLKAIEDHPSHRRLQEEFAERRNALFERMTAEDRRVVAAAEDRVRDAVAAVKLRAR